MLVRLKTSFAEERERWVLWLAPTQGVGVVLYFSLPEEPGTWVAGLGWLLLLASILLFRRKHTILLLLVGVAFLLLGYHAAQLRTALVAAPQLTRDIGPVDLEARVLAAEPLTRGYRLLLTDAVVEGLSREETPFRLRLSVPALEFAPAPGALVKALVGLRPPAAPAAPGDYDFARAAWFQQLGAVGFAYGRPEVGEVAVRAGVTAWWRNFWAALRQEINGRVVEVLPGATGGVALALITGSRGALPAQELEEVRDSGLAHLLAISGLHVGLVTGMIFLTVRAAFSLWPAVALRYPIKELAALIALGGAGAYLLLADAPIPTQRAFMMTALALVGVLAGRTAITLYTVAWAAIAVLLWAPESLLSASFQMSFGAVVGLVSAYEALRQWREGRLARRGPRRGWERPSLYVGGVIFTSLIASLAVAPMTLHHFSHLPLYSLLANLIAVPVTGVWVMPAALLALLAMPLGWEQPFLVMMGWGVDVILAVASFVAGLEGAVLRLRSMASWGYGATVLGGLWLCLWRRTWRLLGLLPLVVGLGSFTWASPPDLFLSGDGRLVALRSAEGSLLFNSRRIARFTAEQWLARAGVEEAGLLPASGELLWPDLACDDYGCILSRAGLEIALVFSGEALEEDCRRADIVLATIAVPRGCGEGPAAPQIVIDRRDLRRDGGLTLWLEEGGRYRLERVAHQRGNRPWSGFGS